MCVLGGGRKDTCERTSPRRRGRFAPPGPDPAPGPGLRLSRAERALRGLSGPAGGSGVPEGFRVGLGAGKQRSRDQPIDSDAPAVPRPLQGGENGPKRTYKKGR